MNKIIKTLDYLFNILLLTYPKLYREEYGFEVQGVFRQIIHDAARQNTFQLALVTLRELRDYPITLIREHWVNYHQKEFAMVTNTPSLTINSCPRCGSIKEIDARYCPTCGLAFIPFKEYITEQSKNFFNAKLPLRIFGILTFIILSFITADRILFHGFHPATNIIVLSGAALFSFLTGWRLFSNVPNSKKLRFLMVIAVITLVFFKLSSELDEIYLRNTITAENPLSYQFLDSETYVAYVEEEKQVFYSDQHLTPNRSWIQMYHYFPPYDNIPPTGFSIGFESSQPYTITLNHPALVIERSWAFKDYYFLFSTLLIAAFTSAGFFTAKKIAKRNFVKKS